jgi:hypothetical protein
MGGQLIDSCVGTFTQALEKGCPHEQFGDAYATYQGRVSALIPFLL